MLVKLFREKRQNIFLLYALTLCISISISSCNIFYKNPKTYSKYHKTKNRKLFIIENNMFSNKTIDKVIREAQKYIGTPYKYGGMSRKGIDCSAFTLLSYKASGVNLPRTAHLQAQEGKVIKKNMLRRGDLVFFATSRNPKRITHSGIVIGKKRSETYFIHATTSEGVIVSSMNNSYWLKRYLTARRIILDDKLIIENHVKFRPEKDKTPLIPGETILEEDFNGKFIKEVF